MADCRGRFRGKEVASRLLEEFQDGLVLPRGCVCDIDYYLRAGERFGQSLAGDGVDACGGDAATTSWPR
jgi:hypothetical protein